MLVLSGFTLSHRNAQLQCQILEMSAVVILLLSKMSVLATVFSKPTEYEK